MYFEIILLNLFCPVFLQGCCVGCDMSLTYHSSPGSARPTSLMQGKAKQVYSALVLLSTCLILGATICSQCNLTFLEIKVWLAAI